MARKRQTANERRRKMRTCDSEPEPELEIDNEDSKLSHEDLCHPSDTRNYHSNSLEVEVESPISNEKAHLIDQTMPYLVPRHVRGSIARHEHRAKGRLSNSSDQFNFKRTSLQFQNSGKVNHRLRGSDYYRAALRGKWEVFENAPYTNMELTDRGERPLHVAAAAKQTALVHNLVEHLNASDLELPNKRGDTAFHFAALSGVVEMAMVMYEKNNNLPRIRSSMRMTPLEMAVLLGNREMVKYLYTITPIEVLKAYEYMEILAGIIHIDMYGTAREMLSRNRKDSKLAFSPTTIGTVLKVLAQKPLSQNHTIQELLWERLVSFIATIPYIPYFKRTYSSLQMRRNASFLVHWLLEQIRHSPDLDIIKLIQETQVLHDAAKIGNVEFLTLLIESFPDLIWKIDSRSSSIFHVAVINRQEKVYSLIYQTGVLKDVSTLYKDDEGNNILHMAGKLAPPSRLDIVFGAALQMQRELLWFKEVEKILRPSNVQMKNKSGYTPREFFTVEHRDLQKAGEVWMKETATSCMVVATLIATVAFAAAFTVPGGYKEETGAPILLNNGWFRVFVISDAVAMISSTTAIMLFFSILTSRYREEDFLISLPEEKQGTLPKHFAALAGFPITLYALLNCRLWISLIHSTCWSSRFMFRSGKHRLF